MHTCIHTTVYTHTYTYIHSLRMRLGHVSCMIVQRSHRSLCTDSGQSVYTFWRPPLMRHYTCLSIRLCMTLYGHALVYTCVCADDCIHTRVDIHVCIRLCVYTWCVYAMTPPTSPGQNQNGGILVARSEWAHLNHYTNPASHKCVHLLTNVRIMCMCI